MLSRTILLRVAAFFLLFTCLGHTWGTFMQTPKEETQVIQAEEVMKKTLVPMPIGQPKSFAEIFFGNNISMSMFLFILGILNIILSSNSIELDKSHKQVLIVIIIGSFFVSIVSGIYFFPMPAIFTGIAGLLGSIVYYKEI
ncbi:MAG: hypothetical protein SFU98_13925 [Leptospiraceae bacterium]|nr:hypothetical protein [Leptospiraceae bacterium]